MVVNSTIRTFQEDNICGTFPSTCLLELIRFGLWPVASSPTRVTELVLTDIAIDRAISPNIINYRLYALDNKLRNPDQQKLGTRANTTTDLTVNLASSRWGKFPEISDSQWINIFYYISFSIH